MIVIDCVDFAPQTCDNFNDRYPHPNDAGFAHYSQGLIRATKAIPGD